MICCLAKNKTVLEVAAEFGISHRQVYNIHRSGQPINHDHEKDCIVQG